MTETQPDTPNSNGYQSQSNEDELLAHNYDGIQEYDNPIPGWWHMIFLGSCIFSVLYVVVVHFTPLVPSPEQRYANKIAAAQEAQFGVLREMPLDETKLLTIQGNEQWMSTGQSIFKGTCVVCHGQEGEGIFGLGLNLTDENYQFVTDMMGIVDMITNGSESGKMPAQTKLNPNEVALVAAYAASLRGTNIPGPEGSEAGVPIDPFPEPIKDEVDG